MSAVIPWLDLLAVAAATAASVGALLLARRGAPARSYFADTTLGSSVFGVLGTAFAVILAFVILLVMESFSTARQAAAHEAVAVTQLYRTTTLLSEPAASMLRGQLACYGRAVVADEWAAMDGGHESTLVQGWLDEMGLVLAATEPRSQREAAGFGQWFDRDTERREGRRSRLLEAEPLVPPFLWVVLVLSAALVVGYLMLFAARRERAGVQAVMVGSLTAMIAMGLFLVVHLDRPYRLIPPEEMQRTLALMQATRLPAASPPLAVPCDEQGVAPDSR